MTDTSVADQTWTPPPNAPSPLGALAGVWQRGVGKTPDQPTTVASLEVGKPAPTMQPPDQPPVDQIRPQPRPWSKGEAPPRASPPDTPALSPTGMPPPIRRFSPYIPAQPIREPDQWGMPVPFSPMPESFEVPGINRGIGNWFGQNGSGITALLGMGLGKYSGDFMKGYMNGLEFTSKMQREKMEEHAKELEWRQQQETDAYADVWNTYNANGYKPLNGKTIDEALGEVAARYNDHNMEVTLSTSGAQGAYKLMQNRDSKWQDLHASNKKTEDSNVDDAGWGLKDKPDAGAGDQSGLPATLGQPARPGAAAPGAAAPPTASGAPAPTAAKPGQPSPASDAADPFEAGSPGEQEEMNVVHGYSPETSLPPDIKRAAVKGAMAKNKQLDDIIADPSIKPEDVIPRVKAINPTLGAELQNYVDYRKGPGTQGSAMGGKEAEFWNRMASLATKAKPGDPEHGVSGWSQSNWAAIQHFKTNTQVQNAIGRAVTITTTGKQVLDDLKDLPKDADGAMGEAFDKIKAGAFTGDERYVALYNDWLKYNQEVNVLIRGGSPSVTETGEAVNIVPPLFGTKADYAIAIVHDAQIAKARLDQYGNQWKQYGSPDPMPGSDEMSYDTLRDIAGLRASEK